METTGDKMNIKVFAMKTIPFTIKSVITLHLQEVTTAEDVLCMVSSSRISRIESPNTRD